jgi:hypothetical protein
VVMESVLGCPVRISEFSMGFLDGNARLTLGRDGDRSLPDPFGGRPAV